MKKNFFSYMLLFSLAIISLLYFFENNFICASFKTKLNTSANSLNLNSDYIISYTSFTDEKSRLITLSTRGIDSFLEIKDISLENMILSGNEYYIQSRLSGSLYKVTEKGTIKILEMPSLHNLTNNFTVGNSIAVITNNGFHTMKGEQYYNSGIIYPKDNIWSEFNLDKGFFTSAISLNNKFYVLTFNPTIRQEQLLKINNNGDILKEFKLSKNKSMHGHKSLALLNNTIYLISDHGKLSVIKDDQIYTKKITDLGEVFKIISDNKYIYISYYNGIILKILGDKVVDKVHLDNKFTDQIFVDIKLKNDQFHLLTVYDNRLKQQEEYAGKIISFNKNNGKIISVYDLPKIEGVSPSSFGVLSKNK